MRKLLIVLAVSALMWFSTFSFAFALPTSLIYRNAGSAEEPGFYLVSFESEEEIFIGVENDIPERFGQAMADGQTGVGEWIVGLGFDLDEVPEIVDNYFKSTNVFECYEQVVFTADEDLTLWNVIDDVGEALLAFLG